MYSKIKIKCPEHGWFEQTAVAHLLGECGCPRCNESHGEREIANYLAEHNIEFEKEKKFLDCKKTRSLPFDFYLPKLNTCIEFDGKQHFEPTKMFGGDGGLKERQENDKIKTDYCLKNHIRIIRIKYTEPIEDILDLYFKK